jgi:hypothetical protein
MYVNTIRNKFYTCYKNKLRDEKMDSEKYYLAAFAHFKKAFDRVDRRKK